MTIADDAIALPDYLDQPPAVRERFQRMRERPVVLEIRGLEKTFDGQGGQPVVALQDINFEVRRREFICVIGPSGCGKSTLIRILAGLDYPTGGELLLDGKAVEGPSRDRGMVFQSYTLFPWLTVVRNVMFGLKMNNLGSTAAEAEAMQWLDLVGLTKFAQAYPHQLSGGMKQRVAIARALANKPRILLMDEPFGALDAQTRCQMQSHLMEIWRNVNITVLFITHDLEEAIYLADRIVVLGAHPGRVMEIIEVPVPHPRTPDQILSAHFLATKKRLEALIHPPAAEGHEHEGRIIRMTEVGDDVF